LLTDVDDSVVGDFPAGLKSEDVEGAGLLRAEVAEGRVRHVVRLSKQDQVFIMSKQDYVFNML
jgi:hypothetical protein